MKGGGIIAICFVGLSLVIMSPALSATPQDYSDCAQTADLDRGIAACTRLIEDPAQTLADRVDAYVTRGNAYLGQGNLDAAIADYGNAIKLDPKNISALSSRAIAYFGKGDHDHAIADYDEARQLDPAQVAEMVAASADLKEIAAAAAVANGPLPPAIGEARTPVQPIPPVDGQGRAGARPPAPVPVRANVVGRQGDQAKDCAHGRKANRAKCERSLAQAKRSRTADNPPVAAPPHLAAKPASKRPARAGANVASAPEPTTRACSGPHSASVFGAAESIATGFAKLAGQLPAGANRAGCAQ